MNSRREPRKTANLFGSVLHRDAPLRLPRMVSRMERATQAESQAIIYELGILSTGEDTVQALEPMAGRKRCERSAWHSERRNKGPFPRRSTDGLNCLSVHALSSLFGSLTERPQAESGNPTATAWSPSALAKPSVARAAWRRVSNASSRPPCELTGTNDDRRLCHENGRSDRNGDDDGLVGQSIQDDENHDYLLSSFLRSPKPALCFCDARSQRRDRLKPRVKPACG